MLLLRSAALCGRHLLLSVATKVSKSALLFQFRSTNESAVAVNFSAITFVWNYPSLSSVWLLLKQPCALHKNSHYYSSSLLEQLTNRFDKNNRSTSTDRYGHNVPLTPLWSNLQSAFYLPCTRHSQTARCGLVALTQPWYKKLALLLIRTTLEDGWRWNNYGSGLRESGWLYRKGRRENLTITELKWKHTRSGLICTMIF